METIADNDGILWLNEKHIGEALNHNIYCINQIIENIDMNQQKNQRDQKIESKQNFFRRKISNQINCGLQNNIYS